MNDEKRQNYLRKMQEGMRPLTEAEMAERQRQAAPEMQNSGMQNSGMQNSGMQQGKGAENFWATNTGHWIPDKPKPTFWQRMKRLILGHNA